MTKQSSDSKTKVGDMGGPCEEQAQTSNLQSLVLSDIDDDTFLELATKAYWQKQVSCECFRYDDCSHNEALKSRLLGKLEPRHQ